MRAGLRRRLGVPGARCHTGRTRTIPDPRHPNEVLISAAQDLVGSPRSPLARTTAADHQAAVPQKPSVAGGMPQSRGMPNTISLSR